MKSSPWATLTLNARAHEALSLPEMRELGNRAVGLHARIGLAGAAHVGWDIQVSSWKRDQDGIAVNRYRVNDQHGHLADLMHAALDEYERRFVFTPDELAVIQRQGAA